MTGAKLPIDLAANAASLGATVLRVSSIDELRDALKVARANVEVALLGSGMRRTERRSRALELLDEVGLADRAEHLPEELSGGERQRVALARALANEPRLLLADEPTGAVDSGTSQLILDLLAELRERRGMTLVIVSYDAQVGIRADRMLTVIDGRVADPD